MKRMFLYAGGCLVIVFAWFTGCFLLQFPLQTKPFL